MTMAHGIIKVDDDLKKDDNFSTFRDDELIKRSNAIDDGADIEITADETLTNEQWNKTEMPSTKLLLLHLREIRLRTVAPFSFRTKTTILLEYLLLFYPFPQNK